MPFIAIRKSDQYRIDITTIESPRLKLKPGACVCQLCGEALFIKSGPIVQAHFAHYGNGNCHSTYRTAPESAEHRQAKIELAQKLKTNYAEYTNAQIEYEVPIHEIRRVADILISFPFGWRIAHEIQLAQITIEELQERTQDYFSIGIDVVWWLGKRADNPTNIDWCVQTFGYALRLNHHQVHDYTSSPSSDSY